MAEEGMAVILVVEDEWLIAEQITQTLRQAGHEVVGPAPKVALALALLREAAPDMALLDVALSGETSFAIAEALAARGIPFVFLTGYDSTNLPFVHRDRPILNKPFTSEQILAAVRGVLAG